MSVEGWKAVREQVELIATEVVEQERSWDVIYGIHQKGLLTEDQVAQLRSLSTRKEQMRQLVYGLVAASCSAGDAARSGRYLSAFLEVLEEQGFGKLVQHLDPSGAHSPHSPGNDISSFSSLKLTPYQHQQPQEWTGGAQGTTTPSNQPYPTLPKPGQDITNNNSKHNNAVTHNNNEDITTDTVDTIAAAASPATTPSTPSSHPPTPGGPLSIVVVPSREVGGKHHHPSEVYKNESEPRGLVFVANYNYFLDEQHETRAGSEIDTRNLTILFSQMGYKTHNHVNLTKYETIQELRNFRNLEEHKAVDSCIVVFMSHGRDDTSFFTSDNQHLTVQYVVESFSNRECPNLKGKPKIFIFQFCRGTGPDIGVDAAPRAKMVANHSLRVETDSSSFGETLVERDPTFTDMYIVYSTVGGFVSFRHPERGSWLVEAICEVFMKDACNTELEHLMKKVSRRVRMNFSTEGNKQACEFAQRAFDRHFYFNPRSLDTMTTLNLRTLADALPLYYSRKPRRRKPLDSPRPLTPEPVERGGARSRNPSSGSTCSEKLSGGLDVLDNKLHDIHAIHPRIRSLSASRRRMSVPEPANLQPCMARGRSFSELNSEGSSPEPSEPGELLAVSTERMSPSSWEHPQRWGSSGSMGGACSRGSYERFPDAIMKEESPLEFPVESFPLTHSQSAVETIRTPDFVDPTGKGTDEKGDKVVRPSYKRQLSVPSNNETLEKVNEVRRYLQIHDSDPNLIQPLKRIESFINKKKNEGKRRKKGEEASSLEY